MKKERKYQVEGKSITKYCKIKEEEEEKESNSIKRNGICSNEICGGR